MGHTTLRRARCSDRTAMLAWKEVGRMEQAAGGPERDLDPARMTTWQTISYNPEQRRSELRGGGPQVPLKPSM